MQELCLLKLSTNIKKYRKISGFSQEQFANKLGVAQAMISRFEAGTKMPSIVLLLKMAEDLGCSISQLLEDAS